MASVSPEDFMGPAQGNAPPSGGMSVDEFMGSPQGTSQVSTGASPASTLGYIGSRLLGGLLEGGKQLGTAAAIEMGQPQQQADMQALPPGQQTADQAIYGQSNVEPPNAAARYGGAVASAVGQNPVMAAITPGYTAASALGSEAVSDINKITGERIPDWAARIAGGTIGGGIYGAGIKPGTIALANKARGIDSILNRADEIVSRIQNGEGRLGEFQLQARETAKDLEQSSANMPQLPPDTAVPLSTTKAFVNSADGSLAKDADKIAALLDKNHGMLTYAELQAIKDHAGSIGESGLYNALKADQRAALVDAHGAAASQAFDEANAARQAAYLLNKSLDAQGFYNPLSLTRKLAVSPGGEHIADASPSMGALTDKATSLFNSVSPAVRANTPKPGLVSRLAKMAAAIGVGHATGAPGMGEVAAGYLLGHPQGGGPSPLYALPRRPLSGFPGSPFAIGAGLSLLDPNNQPSGVLGP